MGINRVSVPRGDAERLKNTVSAGRGEIKHGELWPGRINQFEGWRSGAVRRHIGGWLVQDRERSVRHDPILAFPAGADISSTIEIPSGSSTGSARQPRGRLDLRAG